jgi:hypothetical protein
MKLTHVFLVIVRVIGMRGMQAAHQAVLMLQALYTKLHQAVLAVQAVIIQVLAVLIKALLLAAVQAVPLVVQAAI